MTLTQPEAGPSSVPGTEAGATVARLATVRPEPVDAAERDGAHDHAWQSLTAGRALTYSDYRCSLCGITWSL